MNVNDGAVPLESLPVLDSRVFLNLLALDSDGSLVAEVTEVFLREAPVRLTALYGLVAAGRPVELFRLAHALRGSARSLGLFRVAAVCQEIETAGQAGTVPPRAAIERLDAELVRARAALTTEPATPRGGG